MALWYDVKGDLDEILELCRLPELDRSWCGEIWDGLLVFEPGRPAFLVIMTRRGLQTAVSLPPHRMWGVDEQHTWFEFNGVSMYATELDLYRPETHGSPACAEVAWHMAIQHFCECDDDEPLWFEVVYEGDISKPPNKTVAAILANRILVVVDWELDLLSASLSLSEDVPGLVSHAY